MIRYDAAQASATVPALLDLEALKPLARALSSAVGANCEVVVHDLSRPAESIVCIEGNVTGRRVGEGLTDLGTRALSGEVPDETSLHGYVVNGPDGRTLRCSSIIFRDAAQRPIAALCINIDITPYLTLERLLHELTTPAQSEPLRETFTTALRAACRRWCGARHRRSVVPCPPYRAPTAWRSSARWSGGARSNCTARSRSPLGGSVCRASRS